ncbi:unnamed protein product [Phytomonas sp. Hart1]|nr:unnamed protein product [Phytomonas sp. Hart1]|eukprot:CCW71432.1 unnamed protein product [Phytomonas sp. isolate Hart1]
MLTNLKKCEELTSTTLNCYTTLKKTIIDNTESFINLSTSCKQQIDSVHSMENFIRRLTDNDEFVKFNAQVHSDTLKCIELLTNETKVLQKALEDLKPNQKSYDSVRKEIYKKEAKYAKAGKSLAESSTYHKKTEKRDKVKAIGITKQEEYNTKKENLAKNISVIMFKAYNNYLECTANYTRFLGNGMNEHAQFASSNVFRE